MTLAIDLYCGLGGWAEGLLAEGYDVIGFDTERHVYGEHRYPAQLVIQDVRTLHGSQFRDAALIVASPPCQAYSYRAMPWSRAKALPPPDNELFDACFRIQREACEAAGRHVPMIVENVRGAQPWVGRARWNFGSYYLWGDVPALMPLAKAFKSAGLNWSDPAKPGCFRDVAGRQAIKISGGGAEGWFGSNDHPLRQHHSKHPARKAASAMIAKIPLPLARHIGAVFRGMSTKPPTYHIAITRRADGGRAVIEVGDYIELRDALNDIIARATDSGWFTPSGQPRRRGHPGGRNALPRRRNGSPKEQQSP